MTVALSVMALAMAAAPEWLTSPEPYGLLRWRTVELAREQDGRMSGSVEIGGGRSALARVAGASVLRLRGHFAPGCYPAATRMFGEGRGHAELPLPLSADGGDRILVPPPAVAPGLPGEEAAPPAGYRFELPPGCAPVRLSVYRAELLSDEYGPMRVALALRRAAVANLGEEAVVGWLSAPHPHRWQESAALALASDALLRRFPGAEAPARVLTRGLVEETIAEQRATDLTYAWRRVVSSELPTRSVEGAQGSFHVVERGQALEADLGGADALRIFQRVWLPPEEIAPAAWRVRVSFDGRPPLIALALASRDPEAPTASRQRSVSLPVPPGSRRVRIEPLDRQVLLEAMLLSHKEHLEDLSHKARLADSPARHGAAEYFLAAVQGARDARARLAALLARGRLGDAAALEEAVPLARPSPALTALVAAWRAELELDAARAETLLGRAREALAALGPAGLDSALRPVLAARLVRVEVRLQIAASGHREAARALLRLAAERELCDEDADDLSLAEAFARDALDAGAHSLAVLDGLLARRPLDRGLQIVRSRAFALASYWSALAPESEVREISFLEEPPPEQRAQPRADRFSFVALPADGRALQVDLARPPLPGRSPVLSLIALRGSALARAVAVRIDGEPLSLPVIEPLERFDLPVSPGRHALALDAADFAGEVLVNEAPATIHLRRYTEVPPLGLTFRSHEVGLPGIGLLSLRLAVPAGTGTPDAIELQIEGADARTVTMRLQPGPARLDTRSELGPALAVTDPVEVTVPLSGNAAAIRIRAGPLGGAKLLCHVAMRRHRPAPPAGAPAPGEIPAPPESGDAVQALTAVWRESVRTGTTPGPAPLLARAAALGELDEIALAREDLLTALADPALGQHQRAFVAATWSALDEIGGASPSSVPSGPAALSPSLALSGGRGAVGVGLLALLDDPAALATLSARALRERAGDARDGDLAVLTAARVAAPAGNATRAAALWLDLAARHREVALLRRLAGEAVLAAGDAGPGPARAYLEAFAATRLDPRDAAAQRLLRRAASRTRLRALRFADESAGSVTVRLSATAPLEERADAALLPRAQDAERAALVTRERQANVAFEVARPLRVIIRAAPVELRHHEADALVAPPVVLEWVRDGEPPQRIPCPSGGTCESDPIALVPGLHDLTVRLDGGLRPIARVWVDADRPTDGGATAASSRYPVALDELADHLVSRVDAPMRVRVHGPALVRMEVRSRHGARAAREVQLSIDGPEGPSPRAIAVPPGRDPGASLPDGAEVSAAAVELIPLESDALYRLEVRSRSGDALVRLTVREAAGAGQGEPVAPTHAYRALASAPAALPAGLRSPPSVRVVDGDVVPGLDGLGSLELRTAYVRRDENAAGEPVQASSALVTGFAYRRLLDDLHLTWKVAGDVRVREVGASAESLSAEAFFMHPEHRFLRLQAWASGATQPIAEQRARSGDAGAMVEPVFTLLSGLHLVSKLGGSWTARTMSRIPDARLREVDQDVFTRYAVSHPRALFWEEGVEFEPAVNAVLYANARLTTNRSLSPLDQDHVSATFLARALFGRTYAEAAFRSVWYFVDSDRPNPARRSTVFLSLFQTLWPSARQHLVVGAGASLHLDARAPEFTLYVAWEGSNGRRFADHTPLEGEDYFFPQRGPEAERGHLAVEPP